MVFRKFAGGHPNKWDWSAVGVVPWSQELENEQKARKAEKAKKKKKSQQEKQKLKKAQEKEAKAKEEQEKKLKQEQEELLEIEKKRYSGTFLCSCFVEPRPWKE